MAVKESVFPFNRFTGRTFCSHRKCAQPVRSWTRRGPRHRLRQVADAAGSPLPLGGKVFISVSDAHKREVAAVAKQLRIWVRAGRHQRHGGRSGKGGLKVQRIFKLAEAANAIDLLKNKEIQLVINTPPAHQPG